MRHQAPRRALLAFPLILLGACQQDRAALHGGAMAASSGALALRKLQSRRFETRDEPLVLQAAAGVMQDLGFTIDDARAGAGLIVASKERDAVEAQQVAGQMLLVLLAALARTQHQAVWERDQRIRAAIVVTAGGDAASTLARITFQRVVTNTNNQVSRVETIEDPQIYRAFFDALSQSVFLEANEI
ncbi:hypothetical protein IBL26_16050 [Roseomonas aerophila]|uniref:Uncharacterized protein n=1 Tax=Teichococcus aerophilus TaxID=1224513 RepID=A0ABR7RPY7_9PROT|nr:hypothetical protein [Pseudoroseomonas aerophila]MBC9208359.1 hypothetical protein [Pseudoroseomonas aerophila]